MLKNVPMLVFSESNKDHSGDYVKRGFIGLSAMGGFLVIVCVVTVLTKLLKKPKNKR